MATQAGGAATHHGVLYQALSELAHTFTVTVIGPAENPKTVIVTIEPSGGGGDLVEDTDAARRVYQYKARGDKSTWSLNELINDVFPDLLRAVVNDELRPTEYWFVTEGREGKLEEFFLLRDELAAQPVPESPLDALSKKARPFFPNASVTARTLFSKIAKRAFKTKSQHKDAERLRYRKIWSVLANFHFATESMADKKDFVYRTLLDVVAAREDIPHKARELYGVLLELGSTGHQKLTTEALLKRIGVYWVPLTMLARHPNLRTRLLRRLEDVKYSPATLVHRASGWPPGDWLLAPVGKSGQGKTTLLAQIADETSQTGPVVFVPGAKTIDETLERAANEVWQGVLRHDTPITLEALARRAADVEVAEGPDPWLTLVLDITATKDDVRELLKHRWSEWKIRVAFAASFEKAEDFIDKIHILPLDDFTPRQVRTFLELRGKAGFTIREDVVDLLKRPVVANMYAELEGVADWKPENKYALHNRFWSWIDEAPGQSSHHDSVYVLRLAEMFLDDRSTYPWYEPDLLPTIHPATLACLENVGWIVRTASNEVRFRHDQYLNWAVAKATVQRLVRKVWNVEKLAEELAAIDVEPRSADRPYLGDAAMDALWLGSMEGLSADLSVVLEHFEERDRHIYDDIAELGSAGVPLIIERLRRMAEPHSWYGYRASDALRRIDERAPLPPALLHELLLDPSWWLQDVALKLLADRPDPALLDRIWELRTSREYSEDDFTYRIDYQNLVSDALVAASRLDIAWLRSKIYGTTSGEAIASLLVAVRGNGTSAGRDLWLETKGHVLSLASDSHHVEAARCIERFVDTEETARLELWCRHGTNWLPGSAVRALAHVAPERALDFLSTCDFDWVSWSLSDVLWPLLLALPDRTHAVLRAAIDEGRLSKREIAFSFKGALQLDEHEVESLLKRLTNAITTDPDGAVPSKDPNSRIAEFLVEALDTAASASALGALRRFAETDEASSFARYTIGRLKNSTSTPDFYVRHAHSVLLKMGGVPLEEFLAAQVKHLSKWPRSAIRSVAASPSPSAMTRVHDLLESTAPTGPAASNFALRQVCIETVNDHPIFPRGDHVKFPPSASVNGRRARSASFE